MGAEESLGQGSWVRGKYGLEELQVLAGDGGSRELLRVFAGTPQARHGDERVAQAAGAEYQNRAQQMGAAVWSAGW